MIVVTDEVIADAVAPSFKEALRREGLTLTELLVLKGKPPWSPTINVSRRLLPRYKGF